MVCSFSPADNDKVFIFSMVSVKLEIMLVVLLLMLILLWFVRMLLEVTSSLKVKHESWVMETIAGNEVISDLGFEQDLWELNNYLKVVAPHNFYHNQKSWRKFPHLLQMQHALKHIKFRFSIPPLLESSHPIKTYLFFHIHSVKTYLGIWPIFGARFLVDFSPEKYIKLTHKSVFTICKKADIYPTLNSGLSDKQVDWDFISTDIVWKHNTNNLQCKLSCFSLFA